MSLPFITGRLGCVFISMKMLSAELMYCEIFHDEMFQFGKLKYLRFFLFWSAHNKWK